MFYVDVHDKLQYIVTTYYITETFTRRYMHTKVLVILNTVILYGPSIPGIGLLPLKVATMVYYVTGLSRGCYNLMTTLLVD